MSETETWRGKIKYIPQKAGVSWDDHVINFIKKYKPEYSWMEGDTVECNFDEAFYNEKFIIANGHIFEVLEKEDRQYDDIYESFNNGDGTINYFVQYYNGCMSFNEAVGKALDTEEV